MIVFIALGALLLVIFYAVYTYNKFVRFSLMVNNAWAQIDVQLKRRADLIPALVKVVKDYSKYEANTLNNIARIRTNLSSARNLDDKYKYNNELSSALKSLFIVAESYPILKANENYSNLHKELVVSENKIALSRQVYNDVVYKYNTLLASFPSSIIGRFMKKVEASSFGL
jgi:LemA protein